MHRFLRNLIRLLVKRYSFNREALGVDDLRHLLSDGFLRADSGVYLLFPIRNHLLLLLGRFDLFDFLFDRGLVSGFLDLTSEFGAFERGYVTLGLHRQLLHLALDSTSTLHGHLAIFGRVFFLFFHLGLVVVHLLEELLLGQIRVII